MGSLKRALIVHKLSSQVIGNKSTYAINMGRVGIFPF